MGRRKKVSEFVSAIEPEPVEEELEASQVEEEIEEQNEKPSSVLDKARGILSSGIGNVQDKLGAEPRNKKKTWVPVAKRQEQEKNIATLITSLLVMLVAGWKVPEELKPNEVEMNAVSGCSTSILLRHVNISGRLTQDVIDIIGIVATVAAYVSRTSPAWHVYSEAKKAREALPSDMPRENLSSDEPKPLEVPNVPPFFPSASPA